MEQIRFRTGSRTTYVVSAPDGTLEAAMSSEDWRAAAIAAFDAATEVREDFNGAGAAIPSSSAPLRPEWRHLRRASVEAHLKDGFVPVVVRA